MILGTLLEIRLGTEKAPKDRMIYGSWVALESFYKGLLAWGAFDEYHFFFNSSSTADNFKDNLTDLNINMNRIKLINVDKLPLYLQKTGYTVFIADGLSDFSKMTYLRNRYARALFPVFTLTYSISYPEMLKDEFLENLISDVYPFDSVHCISPAQLKAIKNLYGLTCDYIKKRLKLNLKYKGRLDYLPLAINADDYEKTNKRQARKLLGLPQDKTIILYFGRFSAYDKADLEPLLLAFKKLSEKRDDILLLLAGKDAQGAYGSKVKKIAKDMGIFSKIKIFLNPSLDKKCLLYSASDIFTSPSDCIQESFGLTVLEAMAYRLPVVVSDWDGYKDIVIHKKTGLLVPTYWADCDDEIMYLSRIRTVMQDNFYLAQSVCVDAGKTYEYLLDLIDNKNLRLKLGENGYQRALEKYDWKALIPEYEKLWENCLIYPKILIEIVIKMTFLYLTILNAFVIIRHVC